MSLTSDARFWDRSSRKYAASVISDQAGYERTLERTRDLLKPDDMLLAGGVRDYLATDISEGMIAIANEKHAAAPIPSLVFRAATADALAADAGAFNAVLGFNYLHLVRDMDGTLRRIHALLARDGMLISKTPCVGDMNPLLGLAVPLMRAVGLAPYASVFRATDLSQRIAAAGFEILAMEGHATKGKDRRPFIVARKR
jgi:SAM-dependent methyltransferase